MIVNNFKQIYKYMEDIESFGEDFYILDIVRRRKEHPNLRHNRSLIKTYIISTIDDFKEIENEIVELCDILKARAYFSVNKFSFKKSGFNMLIDLSSRLKHESYTGLQGLFSSSAMGSISGDVKWMLDVDTDSKDVIDELIPTIQLNRAVNGIPNVEFELFKSPNGWHIVIDPFHITEDINKTLNTMEVEVHKNNFIIAYSNT